MQRVVWGSWTWDWIAGGTLRTAPLAAVGAVVGGLAEGAHTGGLPTFLLSAAGAALSVWAVGPAHSASGTDHLDVAAATLGGVCGAGGLLVIAAAADHGVAAATAATLLMAGAMGSMCGAAFSTLLRGHRAR